MTARKFSKRYHMPEADEEEDLASVKAEPPRNSRSLSTHQLSNQKELAIATILKNSFSLSDSKEEAMMYWSKTLLLGSVMKCCSKRERLVDATMVTPWDPLT